MVEFKQFVQEGYISDKEFLEVKATAEELFEILNNEEVLEKINLANQPGNKSQMIQKAFEYEATKLGFTSEKKGLFLQYSTAALRPDYYKKLNKSGIILEVERGKTIQNNMDLLDIWKCHICAEADYLFLMVPKKLFQNSKGKYEKCFEKVCSRIAAFYNNNNYINVKATFIFGY